VGTGETVPILVGWIQSVDLHGAIHDGPGVAFVQWEIGLDLPCAGSIPVPESPAKEFGGQFEGIHHNTLERQ